ncbi:MAG TPA: retroviral-like aspartic protease family protein [Terriglobales bacterium]|nr:retroviral-like aspartic protease family protein [Terriglobales bacterium]
MVKFNSPRRDKRDLQVHGPRIEIEVGRPIIRTKTGILSPTNESPALPAFSRMPALIDTGAKSTLLTPMAVSRLGLRQVDEISLTRAGGITEQVGMYVASIQFPRQKLATIEAIKVVCCELPEQPIQCLIGRDILSRWIFTYTGPGGSWVIEEEDVAPWIEPTSEIDM